jgi:hypothetical protein
MAVLRAAVHMPGLGGGEFAVAVKAPGHFFPAFFARPCPSARATRRSYRSRIGKSRPSLRIPLLLGPRAQFGADVDPELLTLSLTRSR